MYKTTFKSKDGDIVIENNDIGLVEGVDELRQNLENRYAINQGEWFLNQELGLAYKDIVGKGVSDQVIDIAIRDCGFQDDRVSRVENIAVQREAREAQIRFEVVDKNNEELEQEVRG